MKKRLVLVVISMTMLLSVNAQVIKTDVLVLGNGYAAWSAALQAARSGVQAMILSPERQFRIAELDKNEHSGIEQEFLNLARKQSDPGAHMGFSLHEALGNLVLRKWADTAKNLKWLPGTGYIKLFRSGKEWVLRLEGGKTLKAKVLVHAAASALPEVRKAAQANWQEFGYGSSVYKTSLASGGYTGEPVYTKGILTLNQILLPDEENYVELKDFTNSMAAGQAAGAIAAYAVFFKTRTSKVNLKAVQAELLNYKQALLPLSDIAPDDENWKAIQSLVLSGVLKAELGREKALFLPEKGLAFEEVKEPLKALYYKAQIWFDDHGKLPVTLKQTISLIAYVGNRAEDAILREIEKKWKTGYKFKMAFDLEKPLSRRMFAVLLHDYLNPFGVNIDASGRVLR